MIRNFQRGLSLFASDVRHSLSLSILFVIVVLACFLALAVATGFRIGG